MSKQLTIIMKGSTAEVLLYDQLGQDFFGGISAKQFREQIKAIKADTINLRINSPGGDVFEAASMFAALDDFRKSGRVEVDIDGLAASAASVVAMASDKVRVASNGMMMIHDPMTGVLGSADDMRRTAELLDQVKGQILDSYMRKARVPRSKVSDMMSEETWMTGQQAVEVGLADEVSPMVKVANLAGLQPILDRMGYRHLPSHLKPDTATIRDLAIKEQAKAASKPTKADWDDFQRRRALAQQLAQGAILLFTHNSKTAESEPDWGGVDKTELPRLAFADKGEDGKKSTWGYPHHWIEDAGGKDDQGIWTTGTMYLHRGGLNAAWSAANGGRSGQKASQAVIDHLQAHRRALGLED